MKSACVWPAWAPGVRSPLCSAHMWPGCGFCSDSSCAPLWTAAKGTCIASLHRDGTVGRPLLPELQQGKIQEQAAEQAGDLSPSRPVAVMGVTLSRWKAKVCSECWEKLSTGCLRTGPRGHPVGHTGDSQWPRLELLTRLRETSVEPCGTAVSAPAQGKPLHEAVCEQRPRLPALASRSPVLCSRAQLPSWSSW